MSDSDLFGHGAPQGDLFPEAPAQPRKVIDFPDEARRRLMNVLAEARAAATLPWSEREARKWEILFPQMAEWLPTTRRSSFASSSPGNWRGCATPPETRTARFSAIPGAR